MELDIDEVNTAVRQALDRPGARVEEWSLEPMGYRIINPVTAGLVRMSGIAVDDGHHLHWNLVLKQIALTTSDVSPHLAPSTDPRHWNYWRREALAYESGLSDTLPPGLAMPRCFGVFGDDATARMYLEAIEGVAATEWPVMRYELAARHLGHWQGRVLRGEARFDAPWLSHGWLRAWSADLEPEVLSVLDDADRWRHPWVVESLGEAVPSLKKLLAGRERLLNTVEALPRTLCHLDCWAFNLIGRTSAQGEPETVVLDWTSVGDGAPGEDLANLVFDTTWMFQSPLEHFDELHQRVWEGYLLGLQDAGWEGPGARLGYLAAAARFGLLAPNLVRLAHDATRHVSLEQRYGRSAEEVVRTRSAVARKALGFAELALELL